MGRCSSCRRHCVFGFASGAAMPRHRSNMRSIAAHQMEVAGFSREITMIDYGLTNDLQKFITEISIPVKME